MVPVPRPSPKVTPNLLLDGYTDNKRGSTSSISSATGLLDESVGTLRPSPSNFQLPQETSNRYMTNTAFSAPVSRASTRTTTYSRAGGSYGAMGTPGAPASASRPDYRTPSVRSYSIRASGIPPSLKSSFTRPMEQRRSQGPASRPFPLPNPFADPMSRYGTPASTYSTVSHNGKPMDVESGYLIERYQPLVPMSVPPSARFAGYGPPPVPSLPSTPAYSVTGRPEPYTFPPLTNPFDPPQVRSAGGPLRVATTTPHSFHSVAPSWHLADATQQTTTSVPQPAHVRGSSDVTYRSHTTSPRIYSVVEAPLPNPFPPAANRGEVRRFGSMSGPDSGAYHGGHGGTYLSYGRDAENAAHLVGALGTAPPRAEATATTDPMRWKRLVMSAASGRID
ncbi:hypothetical protein EIP86_004224 [Pleurotus ostreatoroseus]|nr:hypothetical protein EIP86_004224 [Pleurotus ostreatoroseus]